MTTTHHPVHMGHVGGHPRHVERRPRKRANGKPTREELHEEILIEEVNVVHGELSRVDSKSSMLLGFAAGGLLLATVTTPPGLGGWLIKAGMALAALSIAPLLAVVKPRLGSGGFPHHATRTVAQVRKELERVNPDTWRSEQLIALSKIAVRKFKLLRIAAGLQTLALVVAFAGAVLILI